MGATGVTPLELVGKWPPPCLGPTDRAPGRAGQWLPPRGAFKWQSVGGHIRGGPRAPDVLGEGCVHLPC